MLKLDSGLSKEIKSQRLALLKKDLSRYFGFLDKGTVSSALAFSQAVGEQRAREFDNRGTTETLVPGDINRNTVQERLNIRETDPVTNDLFQLLLDVGEGGRKAFNDDQRSILEQLAAKVREANGDQSKLRKISRCVKAHYDSSVGIPNTGVSNTILNSDLGEIGFTPAERGSVGEQQQAILDIAKKIVAFRMEHPLLVPGEKNAELLSVFFNAFPTLELQRATPVLDIKLYSSRQVLQDGRLGAITLQKFLEGAAVEETSNQALKAMNLASQVTASLFGNRDQTFQNYSTIGMELFKSPQTLVNREAVKNSGNYLAPVIDPSRPLASIKSFDVEVRSTVGLMSTKTAKLEVVLHDRSRLGEFADFVKPDRYGSSFIEVEYGWSHPDALDTGNPYADLLNLTRVKEHYSIVTSNFSFGDVGEVNITLNLVTRGVAETTELSITGESTTELRSQIARVETLAREINDLASSVFGNPNSAGAQGSQRQEIRGHQMLAAAGDATNYLVLSQELFNDLAELRRSLASRTSGNGNSQPIRNAATQLKRKLDELVGNNQSLSNGSLSSVRRSVNSEILTSLRNINAQGRASNSFDNDIFLRQSPAKERLRNKTTRPSGTQVTAAERSQLATVTNTQSVMSLGTLIMNFVAKPLAKVRDTNSGKPKFEEVQVYFYNFNNKASLMSKCNISQFPVYTDFFAREYSRLRLENTNRAVNLTVAEFISFIANKMIDDPMNPAYLINDLYKKNVEGNELQIVGSQDEFNRRMSNIMTQNNISRSPDFVMPQVTFDLEAVPYAFDPSKTILKLHIYDKVCSPNSTLREMLTLSTNNLLSTLSSFPGDEGAGQAILDNNVQRRQENPTGEQSPPSDSDLLANWRQIHRSVVEYALSRGIIETLPNSQDQYRLKGGPKKLKEMVMQFVPHIIYGCMGTTVKSANLASNSDPLMSTINMQRSLNSDPVLANGEQPGGVPLSIYPVQLSISTFGCPFLRYSQELFVDFNTNTTADNIYYVTGLSHKFEAGTFETTFKLTANDAFGQYRNLIGQLNTARSTIQSLEARATTQPTTTSTQQQPQRRRFRR